MPLLKKVEHTESGLVGITEKGEEVKLTAPGQPDIKYSTDWRREISSRKELEELMAEVAKHDTDDYYLFGESLGVTDTNILGIPYVRFTKRNGE